MIFNLDPLWQVESWYLHKWLNVALQIGLGCFSVHSVPLPHGTLWLRCRKEPRPALPPTPSLGQQARGSQRLVRWRALGLEFSLSSVIINCKDLVKVLNSCVAVISSKEMGPIVWNSCKDLMISCRYSTEHSAWARVNTGKVKTTTAISIFTMEKAARAWKLPCVLGFVVRLCEGSCLVL